MYCENEGMEKIDFFAPREKAVIYVNITSIVQNPA
jgi:hypothetical protein